ncbi:MAG: glycosyltransferase family 4 protein [Desulfobacterota bacterium]|nr:glycosyltransferase family 4 protein [Thermodesulfobacteriota bacterium]MDW8002202.1 glycosyltransferase family 4 protein [Deltaproteobacteria bacterium]
MKILHLISDWKWTGPAEPVVSLCQALLEEGIEVRIAYRKTPIVFPERTIESEVKRRGIPFYEKFKLNRYFSAKDWIYDLFEIGRYCEKEGIEICHTHLSHDHFLAFFSLILRPRRPLIVRTDHKREGLKKDPFFSFVVKRTDGIVTYSERIRIWDVERFGLDPKRTCVIPPGVNFDFGTIKEMRGELGIRPNDKVIGVIGRLKADRGYDTIIRAFRIVKNKIPDSKLLILGRSSQIEKSVLKPIKEAKIEDHVILAGYRIDDYYSVINCFDLFVMMRAGTDGTARALREVMAMGKPAIVSDSGMLPELVKEGETGFVVPKDEAILAERIITLLLNDDLRRRMGENARIYASENWTYRMQAHRLIEFYERLLYEKTKNRHRS